MGPFNRYAITNAVTKGVTMGRPYFKIAKAAANRMAKYMQLIINTFLSSVFITSVPFCFLPQPESIK